jgi:branched-chain amino acid transport system permease protein
MGKTTATQKKDMKNLTNILVVVAYVVSILAAYMLLSYLIENKVLNRQYTALVIPVGINIILAVSLNITTGFLGELSLGHAGFMAIGAYTGAFITTTNPNMDSILAMVIAMVAGGIMAAIFGVLIGMPVLRLRGDYLAIVTLAFGEIIRSIINSMESLGGPAGIKKIPTYSNYKLVFAFVVITIFVSMHLKKSRHGRAIYAIRENYIAAEAMGVPVTKFKILAFTIAAFFAGIAGVLYAHNARIIQPTYFDYNLSIDILVFVVLGGMGSIKGSVIAAIVLTVLPESLRSFGNFRMITYALALIIIMIVNSSNLRDKLKAFVPRANVAKQKGEN